MMEDTSPPGSRPKKAPKPYDINPMPIGDKILPNEICSILNPDGSTSSVSFAVALLAAMQTCCRALHEALQVVCWYSINVNHRLTSDHTAQEQRASQPCVGFYISLPAESRSLGTSLQLPATHVTNAAKLAN